MREGEAGGEESDRNRSVHWSQGQMFTCGRQRHGGESGKGLMVIRWSSYHPFCLQVLLEVGAVKPSSPSV